jgi:membrane protein implicated in regulation of membrane protease activity
MTALNVSNYWVIAGIALLVGEMLTSGFFLLFIALGCFAASLTAAFDLPPLVQMGACAVVAVIGVAALRKTLQRKMLKSIHNLSADVGKEIQIDKAVPPHQRARITYQGTSWEAHNVGHEDIKKGDCVVIVGVDGISLLLRKVN